MFVTVYMIINKCEITKRLKNIEKIHKTCDINATNGANRLIHTCINKVS